MDEIAIGACAMGLTSFIRTRVPWIDAHGLTWFVAIAAGPGAALLLWYTGNLESSLTAALRLGVLVTLVTNGIWDGGKAVTSAVSTLGRGSRPGQRPTPGGGMH